MIPVNAVAEDTIDAMSGLTAGLANFVVTDSTASGTSGTSGASGENSALNNSLEEFLYMCPDTGMIVCMIADGDGFRPATAAQEMESMDSFPASWFDKAGDAKSSFEAQESSNAISATSLLGDRFNEIEFDQSHTQDQDRLFLEMFDNYEHSFPAPFSG